MMSGGYAADMLPEVVEADQCNFLHIPLISDQDLDFPELKIRQLQSFATAEEFEDVRISVVRCKESKADMRTDIVHFSIGMLTSQVKRMAPHAAGMIVVELRPHRKMSDVELRDFAQRASDWVREDVMVDGHIHIMPSSLAA